LLFGYTAVTDAKSEVFLFGKTRDRQEINNTCNEMTGVAITCFYW